MNSLIDPEWTIQAPQARLEIADITLSEMFLTYDQATFKTSQTRDGWWQRTLGINALHWIRLSGHTRVKPQDALRLVLTKRDRRSLPLLAIPAVLLLATSPNPDDYAHRQLFRSLASGLHELEPLLSNPRTTVGWNEQASADVASFAWAMIDALLQNQRRIPWPTQDGTIVQVLMQLAADLWTFPPMLVRRLVKVTAEQRERAAELDAAWDADEDTEMMGAVQESYVIVATLLAHLSAPQLWQNPSQTVRGLALRTSPLHLVPAWYQALLLMHPDAPPISDVQLAWLCDGTLGDQRAAPLAVLWDDWLDSSVTNEHPGEQPRLEQLRNDAAKEVRIPDQQWEEPTADNWPLLHALGVQTLRVIATANGCWIRLIDTGWGTVLWWQPEPEPPLCWSLAFAQPLQSPNLLALHKMLWMLWDRLCIHAQPDLER